MKQKFFQILLALRPENDEVTLTSYGIYDDEHLAYDFADSLRDRMFNLQDSSFDVFVVSHEFEL